MESNGGKNFRFIHSYVFFNCQTVLGEGAWKVGCDDSYGQASERI